MTSAFKTLATLMQYKGTIEQCGGSRGVGALKYDVVSRHDQENTVQVVFF